MIRRQEMSRTLIGQARCERVELGGPSAKPFFLARLTRQAAESLLELLKELAQREERSWYHLTSSNPDPKRLRLVDLHRTPEYELAAHTDYLRGEIFRVTGKENSCNINFSGPVGAQLLSGRL